MRGIRWLGVWVGAGLLLSPLVGAEPLTQRRQAEAERLAKAGNAAHRDGDRLTLQLTDGKTRVLQDLSQCTRHEDCLLQVWEGLQGGGRYHQIAVYFSEGGQWLWVDRHDAGGTTPLPAQPRISPDGRWLLAVSEAEVHDPAGVWMWWLGPNGPAQRLAHEKEPFRFLGWEPDSSARLLRLRADPRCATAYRGTPYRLDLDRDGIARLQRRPGPTLCLKGQPAGR